MRLLEIISPGNFHLIQVPTHNNLSYAILSHTWIYGEEVTYQDFTSGTGIHKAGYEKIKFCGEQAHKDGLRYFWVDTCCIDKSNNTELTTAINSMFRWYQNATKCYVYLADVSAASSNKQTLIDQTVWEAAFRMSKWFTRGWTLQELIAPTVVEFFSKDRKRLGSKKSLGMLVHEITRIPFEALPGNNLSDFNIATRIEWAAHRETTEEEDMIYCLLGLCEVSMALIYGEGKRAAQKRLEMTVREFSKSNSQPNSAEENEGHFIVPFNRNPNFTGRTIQLAKLEEMVFRQNHTTKLAVTGLGGVGKTQLVIELMYRIKAKNKKCSIIWIPATNKESLHQAYLKVAQQLGIPGSEKEKADVKRLVQDYLSKRSAGQWFLIFDNADNIDMWIGKTTFEQESDRLIEYLPRSEHGLIIFTTRDWKAAVKLAQKNIIEVPEMDEDTAICLLQKCLVDPDLVNNRTDTNVLLKELTYLPLAIVQATAYINENKIQIAEYLSLLADQEEQVIELLSEDFEDDRRYHNVKNPVATTWLISFEQIRHHDLLAADYLSFIACIDSKDIPQSLLPAGQSRKRETDAIGTLKAYSFIIKRSADQFFDLHRLVHLATRNWLRQQNLIANWTERAILRMNEVFPDNDHKNRTLWRTYFPHVRQALISNGSGMDGENRRSLAWRYGKCLYSDGRYNEAEGQYIEVLRAEQRVLGVEHPDTLNTMINLAATYWNQGRLQMAENLEVQVLEIRKRVLGVEHPHTLNSMANLAVTYSGQGRLQETEKLKLQVLEIRKRVLGEKHPDTVASMANLAVTYSGQGRFQEAEKLKLQVLEIRKRALGEKHPDTLNSMVNLAVTYSSQGRLQEAESLEVQVLEIRTRVLGVEHPDTLTSMANLAATYSGQRRFQETENLEVQVLEIRKKVLGAEHPDTLTSMANLAATYSDQERLQEAESLEVQVLEIKTRVLGVEHPSTLTSMANLAATYSDQERFQEAESLAVQVLEIRKRVLGEKHPDTLTSMANLTIIWRALGKTK
ncbi:hypothetical protein B0O99DRAFT_694230 [Bisporella sp. PMI_857]|nr:hypothetical protein B0O99DRAFT_694230 [Bisporella sp. PMI_857]